MLYTVEQVANKLNVSKVTIYNKLKLNQFKDKIVISQGQTMIDDNLLSLLKQSIKFTVKFIDDDIQVPNMLQRFGQILPSKKNIYISNSTALMNVILKYF